MMFCSVCLKSLSWMDASIFFIVIKALKHKRAPFKYAHYLTRMSDIVRFVSSDWHLSLQTFTSCKSKHNYNDETYHIRASNTCFSINTRFKGLTLYNIHTYIALHATEQWLSVEYNKCPYLSSLLRQSYVPVYWIKDKNLTPFIFV